MNAQEARLACGMATNVGLQQRVAQCADRITAAVLWLTTNCYQRAICGDLTA